MPELGEAGRAQLRSVLELLAGDERSLSSVRDPEQGWRAHVEDSLTGLVVPELVAADRIADVGAGAGFPGLALACALPDARIDLLESVAKKATFIEEASRTASIANAFAVPLRSEKWAATSPPDGGRESYGVVTARAVARLASLAELASPLLRDGGVLVAWKGRRDPTEEREADAAVDRTAMRPEQVLEVGERAGFEHRHLHVLRKIGPTPDDLPRRPGMAKKRPFGRAS